MLSTQGIGIILASAAALAALWQGFLLRRQLRHSERITETQLYFNVANTLRELDVFFVDRPELRPYFYEKKPLPGDELERARLEASAEMIADLAESVIACGPGLGPMAIDWDKYFAFLFNNSPALQEYWRRFGYYYPESVRRAFGVPAHS